MILHITLHITYNLSWSSEMTLLNIYEYISTERDEYNI